MNLFAYGTLMDPRIIGRVTGRSFPKPVAATLQGYRKHDTVLGYPVIFPDSEHSVQGVVFYSLTEQDWKKLDAYEDVNVNPPQYFRRLVTVRGAHGTIRAYVYVGNQMYFSSRLITE